MNRLTPRGRNIRYTSVHVPGPRKPRKFGAEELFEYAVKCLAVKSYSTGELKSRLWQKAECTGDIGPVIERLKDIGYLDDKRFAESFASARVENGGVGRQRVLSDLRARRVSAGLAESAADRALQGHNEADLIDAYIERRLPSIAAQGHIADERELARAWRRLRRAGFSSGAILARLKQRARRPELLEDIPEEQADLN